MSANRLYPDNVMVKNYYGDEFSCDKGIAPYVQWFNAHGFATISCCAGHYRADGSLPNDMPYIIFGEKIGKPIRPAIAPLFQSLALGKWRQIIGNVRAYMTDMGESLRLDIETDNVSEEGIASARALVLERIISYLEQEAKKTP